MSTDPAITTRLSPNHRARLDALVNQIVPRPSLRALIEAMIDSECERRGIAAGATKKNTRAHRREAM